MCGRFTQTSWPRELAARLRLAAAPELAPRFNVAPSQPVAAARSAGDAREAVLLRWGLVPFWAKDLKIGYKLINARSETVFEKPSFRVAVRKRRCVIPADGFYEWQKTGGAKQPWYLHPADGGGFAFAGIWERWEPAEGEPVESCTILTTEANALVQPVHNRMPVILPESALDPWLDPGLADPDTLAPLLVPYPPELMAAHPVSRRVNNPRVDEPACIEPLSTGE